MRRLQQVRLQQRKSRLLFKEPEVKRGCNFANTMVKRTPAVISVQPIALHNTKGDALESKVSKHHGVKDKGAWRYPGGNIVRHPDMKINGRGPNGQGGDSFTGAYTDHRDPSEARRKIESNFFITLNTNQTVNYRSPEVDLDARMAAKNALDVLSMDDTMCAYLKFGPKDEHYARDLFEDVISKVEWQAAVEVGENLERLHAHIWLTVHHYSQVQVNMPVMQNLFKKLYNNSLHHPDMKITKRPYISVKLLPTSDWAMIIKQYIHKGMATAEPHPKHLATFPHNLT